MISDFLWSSGLMGPAGKIFGRPSVAVVQGPLRELERITLPRRLSRWLKVPEAEVTRWYEHLKDDLKLAPELRRRWTANTGLPPSRYRGGVSTGGPNDALYLALRALRPHVVVETGVAAGFSTAYILAALADNERGKLFSIDAGNVDPRGLPGESGQRDLSYDSSLGPIGFVVPDRLKSRWGLTVGLSKAALPLLLDKLGTVDVFWHDSDHSYSNMMFEFDAVRPHFLGGGTILSDDVVQNSAFSDLAATVHAVPFYFFGRGGVRVGPST